MSIWVALILGMAFVLGCAARSEGERAKNYDIAIKALTEAGKAKDELIKRLLNDLRIERAKGDAETRV